LKRVELEDKTYFLQRLKWEVYSGCARGIAKMGGGCVRWRINKKDKRGKKVKAEHLSS